MAAKILGGLKKFARTYAHTLIPFFLFVGAGLALYFGYPVTVNWLLAHLGVVFWGLLFVALRITWFLVNNKRKNDAADPNKRHLIPKPLLPPYRQAWRDWFDLIVFMDDTKRRIQYAVVTALAVAAVTIFPLGRSGAVSGPITADSIMQGWELPPNSYYGFMLVLLPPIIWFMMLYVRCNTVSKARNGQIEMIYNLAANALKYPRKATRVRPEERKFQSSRSSIIVKEWGTLVDPKVFFISAPVTLDVTDREPWNTLQKNLETRVPSKNGWHFEFDKMGKGATVSPSNYPSAVLWNGQQNPDPLSFYLGADLDNPGELLEFTFGEVSPHMCTVGSTGSGKTSAVEAIVAQAISKPMPWSDPDDPIYAHVYIIDPKGPFANRWEGRPNITVINGSRDTIDENGVPIDGITAMLRQVEEVAEKMEERGRLIDDMRLAKWLDMPDDVLRQYRIAPVFIAMDEYLDHTDKSNTNTDKAKEENIARAEIQQQAALIARKGRSFGYHLMVIAQAANMTAIGPAFMRQLVVRTMMGNMDDSIYKSFFDTTDVPMLPTQRLTDEGKEKSIPGRGRIQNASGQTIRRMQAFYFGGDKNDDTLNELLPVVSGPNAKTKGYGEDAEEGISLEKSTEELRKSVNLKKEDEESAPEAQPAPASKPKKAQPTKTAEVADADALFGPDEHSCVVEGSSHGTTVKPCVNPKCDNWVCDRHKVSPDGKMWACPTCAKKHVLTRVGLGTIYPWAKNEVERRGGHASWSKNEDGVIAVLTLDNVELMKVTAAYDGSMSAIDGNSLAETPAGIRQMVKENLK